MFISFSNALISGLYAIVFFLANVFIKKDIVSCDNERLNGYASDNVLLIVAIIIFLAGILFDIMSAAKRKKYDEYQSRIIESIWVFSKVLTTIVVPVCALLTLLSPQNSLLLILLVMLIHWIIVYITNIFVYIKYSNNQ